MLIGFIVSAFDGCARESQTFTVVQGRADMPLPLANNSKSLLQGRGVQEPESEQELEPESSKFFRSRIGLGVKFNVKTGEGVGAGVTISLTTCVM